MKYLRNDQIRTLFENALDCVVGMDSEGLIIDWNKQAEKTFGWLRDEVIGKKMSAIIIPHTMRDMHDRGLKRFIDSGYGPALNTRMELKALQKGGNEITVELSVTPIKTDESYLFYAFLRDITERQEVASNLQKAKEAADAANEAKTAFLANMSHEIRTPLGAILGFTDLLVEENATEQDRKFYAEAIHRSGELLSNIINDILDLSKVEAGKMDIERSQVSINDILTDLFSLLKLQAENKGIRLRIHKENPLPHKITTDPMRLRQILMNVVGNAIKFTDHGEVSLTVKMRGPHSSLLEFIIQDTGCGIKSEHIPNLFHPFSQADITSQRRFGGTGLGLSLSRRLANLLGGDVALIKSVVNKGTSFQVLVEANPMSFEDAINQYEESYTPVSTIQLAKLRILVAEDSSDNRILLDRLLKSYGIQVDIVENGELAIQKIMNGSYDLILMDLQMPIMDGYEAVKILRAKGYTKPIIALTAHALQDEKQRCLTLGFNDHVSKPIERDILLRAITRYT